MKVYVVSSCYSPGYDEWDNIICIKSTLESASEMVYKLNEENENTNTFYFYSIFDVEE